MYFCFIFVAREDFVFKIYQDDELFYSGYYLTPFWAMEGNFITKHANFVTYIHLEAVFKKTKYFCITRVSKNENIFCIAERYSFHSLLGRRSNWDFLN